jgi:hypothetical protein
VVREQLGLSIDAVLLPKNPSFRINAYTNYIEAIDGHCDCLDGQKDSEIIVARYVNPKMLQRITT